MGFAVRDEVPWVSSREEYLPFFKTLRGGCLSRRRRENAAILARRVSAPLGCGETGQQRGQQRGHPAMPSRIRPSRMYWFCGDCAEHSARRARLRCPHPHKDEVALLAKVFPKLVAPWVGYFCSPALGVPLAARSIWRSLAKTETWRQGLAKQSPKPKTGSDPNGTSACGARTYGTRGRRPARGTENEVQGTTACIWR
jgi:hypothetical protein